MLAENIVDRGPPRAEGGFRRGPNNEQDEHFCRRKEERRLLGLGSNGELGYESQGAHGYMGVACKGFGSSTSITDTSDWYKLFTESCTEVELGVGVRRNMRDNFLSLKFR